MPAKKTENQETPIVVIEADTPETEEESEATEPVLELPDGPKVDAGNLAEQYELGQVEDKSTIVDSELFAAIANDYVLNLVGARNTAAQEDGYTLRAAHEKMALRLQVQTDGFPDFMGTSQTYIRTVQAMEAAVWTVPPGATDAQKKEHNQRKARVNAAIRKQLERVVMESAVVSYWSGTGYFGDEDGDFDPTRAASATLSEKPEKFAGLKWTTRRVQADGFVSHPSVLADPPTWAKAEIRSLIERAGITQTALRDKYGLGTGTGAGPDGDGNDGNDRPTPETVGAAIAESIGKGEYGDEGAALMVLRVLSALSLKHATEEVKDRETVALIWDRMQGIAALTRKGVGLDTRGNFDEEDAIALDSLRWKVDTDGAVK